MMAAFDEVSGLDVSRETHERLNRYANLVLKWTPHINLISAQSAVDIWRRHILDSAQLLAIAPKDWVTWADLGSGAGLPGLVIAIMEGASDAPRKVTLVESDQRKAAFLRTASRELKLNTQILTDRIETIAPLDADVVSARALGSLTELLGFCQRHLAASGVALLPKGRRVSDEIAEAQRIWRFDLEALKSETDPEAQILRIERIFLA